MKRHPSHSGCQRLFMRGFRFRSSLKKWPARKVFSRGFAARVFGLRPNTCRPAADETKLPVAREKKPVVPRVHPSLINTKNWPMMQYSCVIILEKVSVLNDDLYLLCTLWSEIQFNRPVREYQNTNNCPNKYCKFYLNNSLPQTLPQNMIFKLWSYYLVSFENINESTNGLFINETLYKKAIQTDCHFSKHCSINGRFWANVAIGLPSPLAHYSARPMRFTINVITQKGLYQNKVNFSLVSTYNCKMD